MNRHESQIIIRPLVNEKTTALSKLNQFTFEVVKGANKIEIANAVTQMIKELYPKNKSKVVRVNTAPIRGRFRARRRHGAAPHDSKKAIVHLKGDPIEIFSA